MLDIIVAILFVVIKNINYHLAAEYCFQTVKCVDQVLSPTEEKVSTTFIE